MNEYLFTYWENSYTKVIQVIAAQTLTLAVRLFLSKKVSKNLDYATSFTVKKVVH